MIRSLILLAALPLAACDVEPRNPASGNGAVAINADGDGQVAFDLPFAKGNIKLPASMMTNGEVDLDGVKLMPGSKITGFSVMADDGQEPDVTMGFTAPKPPTEVRAYFASEFAKQGAEAGVTGDVVAAQTKDGDQIAITVTPDGAGSRGSIAIKPKA